MWPVSAPGIDHDPNETVILIPLKSPTSADRTEIGEALGRIGATALLFLREIDEIEWEVDRGASGLYLRSAAKQGNTPGRQISIVGQQIGKEDVAEDWLVFSEPVLSEEGTLVGNVEIAFSTTRGEKGQRDIVRPILKSPLVAYFPTVLETHLGFLIQGPYRTTPSRDNVPRHDAWNRHCVERTAALLVGAVCAMRDRELLDIEALRCLPLDRDKFGDGSMFAPIFESTKGILARGSVLPRLGSGYTSAASAKLSRTQELRELLSPHQLGELFDSEDKMEWLSSEISSDRTPELRQYLMQELGVVEVTPEMIVPRLSKFFLEQQSDAWILTLYQFFSGQPALKGRLSNIPLVRLVDGTHVASHANGQPQAFLPGAVQTDFPTVRSAVCRTDASRNFLRSMGLTEPNPIDDVIRNILPKYRDEEVVVEEREYEGDIHRILGAFATDSKGQRDKLVGMLRATPFVMVVNFGNEAACISRPVNAYIATDRLRGLFSGVPGVRLVDDRYACLRGDDARELLEACGALRYLRPQEDTSLTAGERAELRAQTGHAETSGLNDKIVDWSLDGLESLLNLLPELDTEQRRSRARLLWEELNHLEERRGKGVYTAEYTWTHYGSYRTLVDSAFVRMLNASRWVPDTTGELQRPDLINFGELGWKQSPFLESKILFKPPIIAQLAKEAGIEPDVLDLLKKIGVTNAADLSARLGLQIEQPAAPVNPPESAKTVPNIAITDELESGADASRSRHEGDEDSELSGPGAAAEAAGETKTSSEVDQSPLRDASRAAVGASGGARTFFSYVGSHHEDLSGTGDDADYASKMELESRAIEHILSREPKWQRTAAFNVGYDLTQSDGEGRPNRWCEVKAMAGGLDDRPVALSRAQFECASEHGAGYWLYIVEHVDDDAVRIIRIQDPAGKAKSFTFDRGWIEIAELEGTAD